MKNLVIFVCPTCSKTDLQWYCRIDAYLNDRCPRCEDNAIICYQPETLNPESHIVNDNDMICDSLNTMET